jgi:hypothetical protein
MNKKIVQTLGHSTSRFNEPFLDEVCPFRVFDIASAGTGSLRECRFLDNDRRSLAHLAARWLRGTKKMPRLRGACRGFKRHFLWSVLDRRSQSTHAGLQELYTEARLCLFCGVPSGPTNKSPA